MKSKRYSKNEIQMDIPDSLNVQSDLPEFLAISDDNTQSLLVEFDPPLERREALKRLIRQPLAVNTILDSQLIDAPLPSFGGTVEQKIVQHSREGKAVNFAWALNVKHGDHFIHFQLTVSGSFEDGADDWREVLESLIIV